MARGGTAQGKPATESVSAEEVHRSARREGVLVPTPSTPVRLLSQSPLILKCTDFLSHSACDALTATAGRSRLLAKSEIGGSNAGGVQRTSSTLSIGQRALAEHTLLHNPLNELLESIQSLFHQHSIDGSPRYGFKRPRSDGTLAFEMPQVARYREGELFGQHEDGFPSHIARKKRYNRLCTVLVYLNNSDPSSGEPSDLRAATTFDEHGIISRPHKGTALIFFPSFLSGAPDTPRTRHTAQPAGPTEKWVSQVWLSANCFGSDARTPLSKQTDDFGAKSAKAKRGFGQTK